MRGWQLRTLAEHLQPGTLKGRYPLTRRAVCSCWACWQIHTLGHSCTGDCICTKLPPPHYVDYKLECPVIGHTSAVMSVAFSPDGRWVVSGSDEGLLKIWDAATGAQVSSCV